MLNTVWLTLHTLDDAEICLMFGAGGVTQFYYSEKDGATILSRHNRFDLLVKEDPHYIMGKIGEIRNTIPAKKHKTRKP